MRGDDVRAMQTVLAKLGFDCGRADGIFGPNTLRALTEFQQNYGITADASKVSYSRTVTIPGPSPL